MDHADESASKHHAHCGCGGSHGAQQGAGSQPKSHDDARPTALDIIDERFARGEIDKAEYLEKKQLISERASPPKAGAGRETDPNTDEATRQPR